MAETAARLTQHVLEVLATTAPPARLTQHVLEVLSTEAPPAPPVTTQPHLIVVT